jgi:hypothetical protein
MYFPDVLYMAGFKPCCKYFDKDLVDTSKFKDISIVGISDHENAKRAI